MNKLFLLEPLIIAVIAHPSDRDFFKDRLRVQPLRQVTPAAASVLKFLDVLSSTSVRTREMHGNALCSISYSTCLGVFVEVTANMSISRLLDRLHWRNLRYVRASGLERQHTSLRQAGLAAFCPKF